jgi:hypothetical protein
MRLRKHLFAAATLLLAGAAVAQPPGGGFEPPPFLPPGDAGAFGLPPAGAFENRDGFAAAATSLLAEPEAIKSLYQFRYVADVRWDGEQIVRRVRLSHDDAKAFDDNALAAFRAAITEGRLDWYPGPPADVETWAQWSYYADQLALWDQYVERKMFGSGIKAECSVADVKWPGDPAGKEEGAQQRFVSQEGTVNRLVEKTQNRSLDSQLGDFFSTGQQGGEAGPREFPPSQMDAQAEALYNCLSEGVRSIEDRQYRSMIELDSRLAEREIARNAYKEWREDQSKTMEALVKDWARKYDGDVAVIEGVRYELFRPGKVPKAVMRGANVVESEGRLTPYDVLDEDGILRKPDSLR